MTRQRLKGTLARVLAATLTVLLVSIGFPVAASADPDLGTLPKGFESYATGDLKTALDKDPVVLQPKKNYGIALQWTASEVDTFPEYLDFGIDMGATDFEFAGDITQIPAGIKAISKIEDLGGGQVRVYFYPNAKELMGQQPIEQLEFKFQTELDGQGVERSELSWTGSTGSNDLLIVPDGAQKITGTDNIAKNAGSPTFSGYTAGRNGLVFDPSFSASLNYAVTASSTTEGAIVIEDTLKTDWLDYPDLSQFKVTLETWTDLGEGYGNKTTKTLTTDGLVINPGSRSFTYTGVVPANSTIKIEYAAKLTGNAALLDDLKADLSAKYADAKEGASISLPAKNDLSVTVGTNAAKTTSATGTFGITKYTPPRPGLSGDTLSKSVDKTDLGFREFEVKGSKRVLKTAETLTYTLKADLAKFNPANAPVVDGDQDARFYTLTEDVILTDALPAGGTWLTNSGTGDLEGLSVTLNGSPAALTYVADATNLQKGQYTISGQTLKINVGQDFSDSWVIAAKVRFDTAGMTPSVDGTTMYQTYWFKNQVSMSYSTQGQSNGKHSSNEVTTKVIDRNADNGRDVVDTSVFNKVAQSDVVSAKPETAAIVKYDITVNAGTTNDDVIDLSKTDVVDHIDTSMFDLGRYDSATKSYENVELTAVLTANGTTTNLTGSDFELVWDSANNGVRITPTAETETTIASKVVKGKPSTLVFTLTLKTFPIEGLQVIRLSNSASYLGESAIKGNYTSSVKSAGSSLGAFLNLAKSAYDEKNDRFSTGVRVIPSTISTTDDTASVLFRLSMLVPDNFTAKIDLKDDLNKAGLVFEGFADGVDDDVLTSAAVNLGRNIQLRYEDGVVKITTNGSQTEKGYGRTVFEVYYRAKIENWSAKQDQPIINVAGTSSTTVTISEKYPLNITKVDSSDVTKAISDETARFSVLDADGNVVVKDAFIKNNKLVVKDADGAVKALLVSKPGTYTIREDRAPANYYKTSATVEASVDVNGVTREVLFYNDPMEPGSVSITKAVQGAYSDLLTTKEFVFTWTAVPPAGKLLEDDQKSGIVSVRSGQTITLGTTFPPGTVVTFAEAESSVDLVNHKFNSVTLSPTSVTVVKNSTVSTTATNAYTGMVKVGNYVWVDSNRDGKQDAGETPIEDVQLQLRDSDGNKVTDVHGNEVLPTRTNAAGEYYFVDLPVLSGGKTYVVSIVQDDPTTIDKLAPYVPTITGGGTREEDSSKWTASTVSGELTRGGEFDYSLDFGFVLPSYAVGDVAWIDLNRNGIQDGSEEPLAGVEVTLLDKDGNQARDILGNLVATVATDNDGRYLFDDLAAGDYQVQFTLTAAQAEKYTFTKNVEGDDSNDNSDAVVTSNTAIAVTPVFTLDDSNTALSTKYTDQSFVATQGVDPTWDAGVHLKHVSVGDYVWFDSNRDGVQGDSALEPGIEGVRLELVGPDGNPVVDVFGEPVGPTFTNADGKYTFENLPVLLDENEVYTVKIITDPIITNADGDTVTNPIADLLPTREGGIPGEPADRATDSSTNEATSLPGSLKEHLSEDPTLDFGFMARTFAIGDFTWIDLDRNGLQDAGEKPLAGVTASLLDVNGNPAVDILGKTVASVQTDEYGRYLFDNLAAGEYRVQFTLTSAQAEIYDFTSNEPGTDSTDNSDGVVAKNPAQALTSVIVLDASNKQLTKTYTDGSGNTATLLATEGIDPTWDAGVYLKKVSVGDYVWVDSNRDGVQGDPADEPGIPGVQLEITVTDENGDPILDAQGSPVVVTDVWGDVVDPQVTDADGKYLFEDLPALPSGQFYVVTINREDPDTKKALAPYVPTLAGTTDSDKDSSTWSEKASWEGLQTDGAHNPTLDFGFVVPSYAVGDVVWIDVNRDGLQGTDESPLAGVTVTLLDQDGKPVKDVLGNDVAPVVTDANGRYLFDNLAAGDYKVRFELTAEQAARYVFTTNVAGTDSADNSDAVVTETPAVAESRVFTLDDSNKALSAFYGDQAFIATQGVDPTWDAGVHLKRVSVGDYVWFDADKDGLQSDSEKGIPGIKLYITDKNGYPVTDVFGNPVEPVVTDKNGKYSFENLPALVGDEQYIVRIDQEDADTQTALERYVPTKDGAGDSAFDSSTWVAIATSEGLSEDGDRNPTLDFGFIIDPALEEQGSGVDTETPGESTDVDENSNGGNDGDQQQNQNEDGESSNLPSTGFGGLPISIAAIMLLAAGACLVTFRRKVS